MKFSLNGDSLLKKALSAQDKECEIQKLALSMTKLENGLKESFSSQYSRMISDCSSLDELRETMTQIQVANTKIKNTMQEVQMERNIANSEIGSLEASLERIEIVQRELSSIEEFLQKSFEAEASLSSPTLDRIENVYLLVRNVVDIQKSMQGFKKYYFHLSFETILEKLRSQLKKLVFRSVDEFLHRDFAKIGGEFKACKGFQIFDDFRRVRKEILNRELRDALYCAKYLGLVEEVVDYINSRRSEALRTHGISVPLENNSGAAGKSTDLATDRANVLDSDGRMDSDQSGVPGDDKMVQFCIGSILVSFFLSSKLPKIRTFYEDIFNGLSSCKVQNVLYVSRLRTIARKLNIQSSTLDSMVESAVFRYFDRQLGDATFENDVKAFMDDSIRFLDETNEFAGEFDEILVRKIDDVLTDYLNRATFEDIFERQDTSRRIIEFSKNKRGLFERHSFVAEAEIEMASSRQLEKKVEEFKKFLVEDKDMRQIAEEIISFREIPSATFRKDLGDSLIEKTEELIPNRSGDDKALFVDTVRRNLL